MKSTSYFREKLLKLQKELKQLNSSGKENTRTVELDQSRIGRLSRMDAMQSQAMARESERRRDIQLQRIESAFKRLENGLYGLCVNCEDEINEERLEFDPTTFLCVECAENRE